MSYGVSTTTLNRAVAASGTFDMPYPIGLGSADLGGGGTFWLNDNDRITLTPAFGASAITITNSSGATLAAGSRIRGQFGTLPGGVAAEPAEFSAVAYGARFDGATNDRVAIQAAIDAAALAGGGVVRLPAGECLVSGGTLYALSLTDQSNVTLQGAGRELTRIKVANSANVGPLAMLRANNITLRGLTLDGNSANQVTTGVHGIRCEDVDRLLLDDVGIVNTMGYGLGLQDGTNTKIRVQNFYIANTRLDGTDFKNKDDANEHIVFENGVVENYGWALDGSAGLDIRGPATINNVHFKMAYTGIGIRLRVDDIGNNGTGGKYTTISNIFIDGGGIALTDGIIVDNEYCQVNNVAMKNVMKTGLWFTANANNCSASNVTIRTTATGGQFVECPGARNKFSNISVIGTNNAGDAFRVNGSENLFVNCSAVDTNRGFFTSSGTGGNMYVNCFCNDVTTAYSSTAANFVVASPTVLRPAITGSRGANAALASLLTALAAQGLITDSTS
jgi:hypothetical protein